MSRRTRRVVGQNLRLGVLPYTVISKDAGKSKSDGESKSDAKEAVFLLWKNFRPTVMQSTGFWGELVCEKVKSDDTALTTIARVISTKTQGAFGDPDSTLTAKERVTNCQKRLLQKLNKKVGVYIISRGDHMLYLVPVRYVAQSPLTDLCNHKDGGYVRWVSANSLIDTVCSQTPSAMLSAKSIQGESLPLYLPFVSLLRADSVAHDLASFLEQYGVAQPTTQPPDERNSTFTVVASASADGVRVISAVDTSVATTKGRKSSTRSAHSESDGHEEEEDEDEEEDPAEDEEEEEVEETEENTIDLGDVDEEEEEDCCDDEECSGHGHESKSKTKKGHLPKPQAALVSEPTVSFSCRRCRRALFTDADLVVHEALKKWEGGGLGLFRNKKKSSLEQNLHANMECTSLFLSESGLRQLQGASIAAQRIKPATGAGASATPAPAADSSAALNEDVCFSFAESEGNILCPNPKCLTRVGTYNWAGEQCSCGGWVTPFLQVVKSKVDPKPLKGHSVPTAYTDARERPAEVDASGAAQPTIVRPAIVRPVIFRPPAANTGSSNM